MKMTKFIEEVISSHNAYREQHQAASLRHSSALSDIAQKWAENLAQSNSLQHSQATHGGERLGENISMKWSSKPENYRGTEVTDQWYSEVSMYAFGRDSGSPNTGHFSQVVWRESAEIGVGKAQTRDGKLIVVANYKPAGNVLGRYAQNVLPARWGNVTTPTSSNGRDSNRNFSPSVQHSNFPYQTNMTSTRNESGQSRSVKTYTVTEGSGPNAVTKTVVEETVTLPDGRKTTTKKETVSSGGGSRTIGQGFGGFDRDPGVSSNGVSSKPASPQTMAKFREDCLRSHNTYRRKHGVSPLSESRGLTDHAQKWAEKLASSGRLTHSDCTLSNGDRLGENLAVTWSSSGGDMTGEQSADQWYREVSKMDFSRVGFSTGTGHFTQMVWKGSREFGVGKARSHDGKVFVVANYRPAGNILGEYQQNVFPPKN